MAAETDFVDPLLKIRIGEEGSFPRRELWIERIFRDTNDIKYRASLVTSSSIYDVLCVDSKVEQATFLGLKKVIQFFPGSKINVFFKAEEGKTPS